MLLRGTISAPFPSLRLTTTTTTAAATLAVSRHSPTTNKYSISDEDLDSRGFVLHRSTVDLNLDYLNKVFVAVGFPKRDPAKIRIALDHTDALLWLEYAKTSRPVAFARATGDGVFNAIIWDVVVDPSFQGIGPGRAGPSWSASWTSLWTRASPISLCIRSPGFSGFIGPWALWRTRTGSAEWCIPESPRSTSN